MIEQLLLITYPLFLIVNIRAILFWVSRWQLKEYQLDRFISYLKEANQGKKMLFSPFSLSKLGILVVYPFLSFFPTLFPVYYYVIILIYIGQTYFVAKEIFDRKVKRPIITIKTITLSVGSFLCLLLFSMVPLTDKFVWLVCIDRLLAFIIAGFVYLLFFPTDMYREIIIEQAAKKIRTYKKLLVIGITGSYGKSSTKEYVSQILEKQFTVVKTKGSNNTPIGIAKTILRKIDAQTQVFVAEVAGYRIGNIAKTCQIILPKIGILTAVSNQHVGIFGSVANTMKAKYELIASLPSNGQALFNGNNEHAYTLYKSAKIKKKILYVTANTDKKIQGGDIKAISIIPGQKETTFMVRTASSSLSLTTPLLGKHVVENILPAIYIAKTLGMTDTQIIHAVATLTPLPKTMERKEKNGITYIDDTFNASPESTKAAIDYLTLYTKKRFMVLMPLLELGDFAKNQHFQIGQECADTIDYLFVTNKNFYEDMQEGIESKKGKCILVYAPLVTIALELEKKTKKDDVILFEGKEAGNVLQKFALL